MIFFLKFSADNILRFLLIFFRNQDLTFHVKLSPVETGFDISCKLSPMETVCMKCLILFPMETICIKSPILCSDKKKKKKKKYIYIYIIYIYIYIYISVCCLLKILSKVLRVNTLFHI